MASGPVCSALVWHLQYWLQIVAGLLLCALVQYIFALPLGNGALWYFSTDYISVTGASVVGCAGLPWLPP